MQGKQLIVNLEARTTRPFLWFIVLAGILLSACQVAIPPAEPLVSPSNPPPSSTLIPKETPTEMPTGMSAPEEGALCLNEVRFLPASDQSTFIELRNCGGADFYAAEVTIMNQKSATLVLSKDLPHLPPEGILLLTYEAQAGSTENTLLLRDENFLTADSGSIALHVEGQVVDRVVWGNLPGAVDVGRGGSYEEPQPGMSIGRYPGSFRRARSDWVPFTPDLTTPGEPNAAPPVRVLSPLSGAIFETLPLPLMWYTVPGAVSYRVQVASDPGFEEILLEEIVQIPPFELEEIQPGSYFWRVQAQFKHDISASFSRSSLISFANTSLTDADRPPGLSQLREGWLPVEHIFQKKDTQMLFLETPSQEAISGHPWNAPHARYHPDDIMDNGNCGLASIAMLNHYFGGDLSQDRLGYELLGGGGPEHDLMAGQGLNAIQARALINFALGVDAESLYITYSSETLPVERREELLEAFWQRVVAEIDAGRPLLTAIPGHWFLVVGYENPQYDDRELWINDPSIGRYRVFFDPMIALEYGDLDIPVPEWDLALVLLETPDQARAQEDSIHSDSDGDGIVDFDESNRFHTNPLSRDSDMDGVGDLTEIEASIFHPQGGYGATGDEIWRDYDGDFLAIEIDPDNDGGGCIDGDEDHNANGTFEASQEETDNFDASDDPCWALEMSIEIVEEGNTVHMVWQGGFEVDEAGTVIGDGRGGVIANAPDYPCLLITTDGIEETTNPLRLRGYWDFDIDGEMVDLGDKPKLHLTVPGGEPELWGTYSNPLCGGDIDYDLFGTALVRIMAADPIFLARPRAEYIEIEARGSATTQVILGEGPQIPLEIEISSPAGSGY